MWSHSFHINVDSNMKNKDCLNQSPSWLVSLCHSLSNFRACANCATIISHKTISIGRLETTCDADIDIHPISLFPHIHASAYTNRLCVFNITYTLSIEVICTLIMCGNILIISYIDLAWCAWRTKFHFHQGLHITILKVATHTLQRSSWICWDSLMWIKMELWDGDWTKMACNTKKLSSTDDHTPSRSWSYCRNLGGSGSVLFVWAPDGSIIKL